MRGGNPVAAFSFCGRKRRHRNPPIFKAGSLEWRFL